MAVDQRNYDNSIKVKQEVIDRIKSMGMAKAIAAANSGGESAEFKEGAKRMYGNRVGMDAADRMGAADKAASAQNQNAPSPPKTVPMPKSAPAAATRKINAPTGCGGGTG